MSLQTLLEGWCETVPDVVIDGIGLDSRRVREGQAFIAVAGASTHGIAHAAQAQARGASVVIHDGPARHRRRIILPSPGNAPAAMPESSAPSATVRCTP
jgi:UDP-N-acetylmuramoyl-L-alanyl-D-glutamate--2,6-diaminopimelate ligase